MYDWSTRIAYNGCEIFALCVSFVSFRFYSSRVSIFVRYNCVPSIIGWKNHYLSFQRTRDPSSRHPHTPHRPRSTSIDPPLDPRKIPIIKVYYSGSLPWSKVHIAFLRSMLGVKVVSCNGSLVMGLVYLPHRNHSFMAALSYVNPSNDCWKKFIRLLRYIWYSFYNAKKEKKLINNNNNNNNIDIPEHWTGSFIISCVMGHKNSWGISVSSVISVALESSFFNQYNCFLNISAIFENQLYGV